MKKLFLGLLASMSLTTPVLAKDPLITEWKTHHSMGCMLTRECLERVIKVNSSDTLKAALNADYSEYKEEIDGIITELNKMGVDVYLAPDKYFVPRVAGSYYTVGNDFFLNESYSKDPHQLIKTLRHEAWHAAQDAMAGTIDNTLIAIIRHSEDVPREFVLLAEISYPPEAQPWEAEAKWAGDTPGMTLEVLKIINETNGRPWEVIEPTPLTRQYLVNEGYLK